MVHCWMVSMDIGRKDERSFKVVNQAVMSTNILAAIEKAVEPIREKHHGQPVEVTKAERLVSDVIPL
jgi:hypothetical protein